MRPDCPSVRKWDGKVQFGVILTQYVPSLFNGRLLVVLNDFKFRELPVSFLILIIEKPVFPPGFLFCPSPVFFMPEFVRGKVFEFGIFESKTRNGLDDRMRFFSTPASVIVAQARNAATNATVFVIFISCLLFQPSSFERMSFRENKSCSRKLGPNSQQDLQVP